jgi:hypothetical protein
MSFIEKSRSVVVAWGGSLRLLKQYPVLLTPFLVVGLINGLVLTALFLAPRPPLSIVLAPVIRAFWGEQFLHYPVNFLLLPKLFGYGKNAIDFSLGVILTGMAMTMIAQAEQRTQPSWWFGLKKGVRRYIRLVLIWAVTFAAALLTAKVFSHYAGPLLHSRKLLTGGEFLLGMLMQMLFVFAFPAVIIENKKTFRALGRSLAFFKSHFLETAVLVAVPSLLFLPVLYAYARLPFLMERYFPEMTLYVLALRILTLVAIDIIITLCTTVFFLNARGSETGEVKI